LIHKCYKFLFNDDNLSSNFDIKNSYGETGLKRAMTIKDDKKFKVDYKDETIKNYGEIFDYKNIENYSPKIKLLLDYIKKSEGIVLIYSKLNAAYKFKIIFLKIKKRT